MRKILIVAGREYRAAVRTKTFLIGLLIMPLMMGGSAIMQYLLRDAVDLQEKKFVIVNRSVDPTVVPVLQKAVEQYNVAVADKESGIQKKPKFTLTPEAASSQVSEQRLVLSQRVRAGDLLGFLEILPPDAAETLTGPDQEESDTKVGNVALVLRYQTNRGAYMDFVKFAERNVAEHVRNTLGSHWKLDAEQITTLVRPVFVDNKGLAARNADGTIIDSDDQSRYASLIVPSVLLVLMFMLVLMGSTPLMQGVVEEKMQRIAEVLLGSVRPFELMLGKLLGMTGVSLTIGAVYLLGAYWAAHQFGLSDALTVPIILWFLFFQILASLMFGSLFIAVGAACTEMKETQNLIMPIMIMACIPLFLLGSILREPNGPVIRALTYFPFTTPALMLVRIAIVPNLPWWEPVLGVTVVLTTTLLCVWIAGRVFRVGILLQGKGASLGQIVRWIVKG